MISYFGGRLKTHYGCCHNYHFFKTVKEKEKLALSLTIVG
jgi:hypothetical protein